MKHIKSYKLFESFSPKVKEDIIDIFGDLELNGFKVFVRYTNHFVSYVAMKDAVSVKISRDVFRYSDIKDVIDRLPYYFKTLPDLYRIDVSINNRYYTISEFIKEFTPKHIFRELSIVIYED